jgi:hypothetical protein
MDLVRRTDFVGRGPRQRLVRRGYLSVKAPDRFCFRIVGKPVHPYRHANKSLSAQLRQFCEFLVNGYADRN